MTVGKFSPCSAQLAYKEGSILDSLLCFYAYWLKKIVPSKKSRHGYWPFWSSRSYFPKKLGEGGGGVKYQNILTTIDRVWGVGEGYLGIQDLTQDILRDSEKHKIYPRDKLSTTREADSSISRHDMQNLGCEIGVKKERDCGIRIWWLDTVKFRK